MILQYFMLHVLWVLLCRSSPVDLRIINRCQVSLNHKINRYCVTGWDFERVFPHVVTHICYHALVTQYWMINKQSVSEFHPRWFVCSCGKTCGNAKFEIIPNSWLVFICLIYPQLYFSISLVNLMSVFWWGQWCFIGKSEILHESMNRFTR